MAARRATKRRTKRRSTTKRRRTVSKRRVTRRRKVSRRKASKKRVVRKRRKARKVSIRGTRKQVFRGTRTKVKTTGQVKADLMMNKRGKIVSKAAHKAGKKAYSQIKGWTAAFSKARKNLGITGFQPCKKGSKLYKETMRIYKA